MKKFYLFIVLLFAAIAANAETLSVALTGYYGNTSDTAEIEATVADGVVTIPDFFGSGIEFQVTCYSDGTATHNQSAGDLAGSFNFGEAIGTYDSIYLYGGTTDFEYEDGILYGEFWAGSDYSEYVYVDITLPEGFEPVEVEEAEYIGMPYTVQAVISDYYKTYFETENISMTAYFNNGVITIPNYLGGGVTVTYTLTTDEEGNTTASGGVPAGYTDLDFTGGETNFNSTWGLGTCAKYYTDSETNANILYDGYYVYTTAGNYHDYTWFDVYITLPNLADATISIGRDSKSSIQVPYVLGEAGVITFPEILATSQNPTFTIYNDGEISNDIARGNYYSGQLGELGTDGIYISNDSYTTQSYSERDGVKSLSISSYLENNSSKYTLKVTLPDEFTTKEREPNCNIYAIDEEGNVSEEAIPTYIKQSVSGSTLTISNPFGSSNFTFPLTMQNDGTVISSFDVGGYFTKSYTFNGNSYARLYDYARSYDVDSHVFTWTIGLQTDVNDESTISKFNVVIELPEDFESQEPQVLESYQTTLSYLRNGVVELPISVYYDTTVDVAKKSENLVTITKIFNASVSIKVTWDAEGNVTTEGSFPSSQWYYINKKYYSKIAIDNSAAKYVQNDEDEYLELPMSINGGYNGATEYAQATCRIYFVKNSVTETLPTIETYTCTYDEEAEDWNEEYSEVDSYYTVDNAYLTVKNFLDSEYDLTIHFFDDGTAAINLEGTIEGTFYVLDGEYSSVQFVEGEAGYTEDGSYGDYAYVDFYLDGTLVTFGFYVPEDVLYDEATGVSNIAVDGSANANAVYYNLQGVRVVNPSNGIYIVRQGNKVSKVLVK